MDWQPIETAPKETTIIVYGYNMYGQLLAGGPYRFYRRTVGQITHDGKCDDLLDPGCDCIRGGTIEHPTHWMPLPEPPSP